MAYKVRLIHRDSVSDFGICFALSVRGINQNGCKCENETSPLNYQLIKTFKFLHYSYNQGVKETYYRKLFRKSYKGNFSSQFCGDFVFKGMKSIPLELTISFSPHSLSSRPDIEPFLIMPSNSTDYKAG